MTNTTKTIAMMLALTGCTLTGCTGQLSVDEEELGHDSHEMLVTPAELTDGWSRDGDWLVSPALDAPDGASRVGVFVGLVEEGALPTLEARPLLGGEPVGDWVAIDATWSEVDHHVGVAELGTIGDGAELRIAASESERLALFRWSAVIPEEAVPMSVDEELGASQEALRRELSGLGIVTRSAWGARATRCTSRNSSKARMAIHHTVTPSSNPARQMRGIQRYHMDSRGWCDVGYHFLVGQDGKVYEGRPLHLIGAHVGGHNTGNIGISFIGCFHRSGCNTSTYGPNRPNDASIRAAGRLVGELSRLYGITINTSNLKGHRDHSGQGTSCPGDYLHARLGDIRSIGRSGGGGSTPPPSSGGSCTHSLGGNYANRACSASWQCCDGRWGSRGSCGSCLCTETSGRTGCTSAGGGSTPTPPPGASCTHSYGGRYVNTACSASYQCCDGRWGSRGSCGSCFCTETSGRSGCSSPSGPPPPPPGASCGHSYGGRYANTACSASWQCCDGRWGSRGSCGSCYCTEESGRTGCGT